MPEDLLSHAAGKLHFVKFETSKIAQALDFIKANCLHMYLTNGNGKKRVVRIKATGGGAFKFADIFQVLLSHAGKTSPRARICWRGCMSGLHCI